MSRRNSRIKLLFQLPANIALAIGIAISPAAAKSASIGLQDFSALAKRCGPSVSVATLAAIAKTESGFRPHVVGDNTTGRRGDYPTTEEARVVAERLIGLGHSVDIGLMQINSLNLKGLGLHVRDVLDPCRSIAAGANILTRNYLHSRDIADAQTALRNALSEYNTGNRRAGYRNGYVSRVEEAARNLVPAFAATSAKTLLVRAAPSVGTAAPSSSSDRWWDVWSSPRSSPVRETALYQLKRVAIF